MSFMEAQLTEKIEWLEVDGPMGGEWVPLEDINAEVARRFVRQVKGRVGGRSTGGHSIPREIADYIENSVAWSARIVKGYGVRSSAPGYMDATHYSVYSSLRDAKRAYREEQRELRGDD